MEDFYFVLSNGQLFASNEASSNRAISLGDYNLSSNITSDRKGVFGGNDFYWVASSGLKKHISGAPSATQLSLRGLAVFRYDVYDTHYYTHLFGYYGGQHDGFSISDTHFINPISKRFYWMSSEFSVSGNNDCNICTLEYAPVCGTDNKNYTNQCWARCVGVEVQSSGTCESPTPGDPLGTEVRYTLNWVNEGSSLVRGPGIIPYFNDSTTLLQAVNVKTVGKTRDYFIFESSSSPIQLLVGSDSILTKSAVGEDIINYAPFPFLKGEFYFTGEDGNLYKMYGTDENIFKFPKNTQQVLNGETIGATIFFDRNMYSNNQNCFFTSTTDAGSNNSGVMCYPINNIAGTAYNYMGSNPCGGSYFNKNINSDYNLFWLAEGSSSPVSLGTKYRNLVFSDPITYCGGDAYWSASNSSGVDRNLYKAVGGDWNYLGKVKVGSFNPDGDTYESAVLNCLEGGQLVWPGAGGNGLFRSLKGSLSFEPLISSGNNYMFYFKSTPINMGDIVHSGGEWIFGLNYDLLSSKSYLSFNPLVTNNYLVYLNGNLTLLTPTGKVVIDSVTGPKEDIGFCGADFYYEKNGHIMKLVYNQQVPIDLGAGTIAQANCLAGEYTFASPYIKAIFEWPCGTGIYCRSNSGSNLSLASILPLGINGWTKSNYGVSNFAASSSGTDRDLSECTSFNLPQCTSSLPSNSARADTAEEQLLFDNDYVLTEFNHTNYFGSLSELYTFENYINYYYQQSMCEASCNYGYHKVGQICIKNSPINNYFFGLEGSSTPSTQCVGLGMSCCSRIDCCDGYACSSITNTCVASLPGGVDCNYSDQCLSGICNGTSKTCDEMNCNVVANGLIVDGEAYSLSESSIDVLSKAFDSNWTKYFIVQSSESGTNSYACSLSSLNTFNAAATGGIEYYCGRDLYWKKWFNVGMNSFNSINKSTHGDYSPFSFDSNANTSFVETPASCCGNDFYFGETRSNKILKSESSKKSVSQIGFGLVSDSKCCYSDYYWNDTNYNVGGDKADVYKSSEGSLNASNIGLGFTSEGICCGCDFYWGEREAYPEVPADIDGALGWILNKSTVNSSVGSNELLGSSTHLVVPYWWPIEKSDPILVPLRCGVDYRNMVCFNGNLYVRMNYDLPRSQIVKEGDWYVCESGEDVCVPMTEALPVTPPACVGTQPQNSIICPCDEFGLGGEIPLTLVSNCTNQTKCEYECKKGFFNQGNSCVSLCGNGSCDSLLGETINNCPQDCAISCVGLNSACVTSSNCCSGLICVNNICSSPFCNNNGVANAGETCSSCPGDVKCDWNQSCINGVCSSVNSILKFNLFIDNNKLYSAVKCIFNTRADFNVFLDGNQIKSFSSDCNKVEQTIFVNNVDKTKATYSAVIKIKTACDVCVKEAFVYVEGTKQGRIPDANIFSAILVVFVILFVLIMPKEKKSTKK